uniref:Secreted Allatotropin-like protein n=1 Tax=Pristhesancus plagipennis TaxID=1955184 RepID=A0A2K8JMH0_PRIPG|nr:secreted Allatotropin-like protein [Pristhesancus plagipennis]
MMRWSALLLLVILASIVDSIWAGSATSYSASGRAGRTRTIRGFKNAQLSTARGFGKRTSVESQLQPDLIPADWMAEELSTNPELARLIVRRFIDIDQDGLVSPIELLRNTVCQEPN